MTPGEALYRFAQRFGLIEDAEAWEDLRDADDPDDEGGQYIWEEAAIEAIKAWRDRELEKLCG